MYVMMQASSLVWSRDGQPSGHYMDVRLNYAYYPNIFLLRNEFVPFFVVRIHVYKAGFYYMVIVIKTVVKKCFL